jgi:hypothetical protein
MYCTLIWGKRGYGGCLKPPIWEGCGGLGAGAPKKYFFGLFLVVFCFHFLAVFRHMVFVDGFLIPVKELGLLTNLGQWIMDVDVVGSYMYIVL